MGASQDIGGARLHLYACSGTPSRIAESVSLPNSSVRLAVSGEPEWLVTICLRCAVECAAETDSNPLQRLADNRRAMTEPAWVKPSGLLLFPYLPRVSDATCGRTANLLLSHQTGVRIPV